MKHNKQCFIRVVFSISFHSNGHTLRNYPQTITEKPSVVHSDKQYQYHMKVLLNIVHLDGCQAELDKTVLNLKKGNLPLLFHHYVSQWLPESCRYYLASGEKDKAMRMLQRVARTNKKDMPGGYLQDASEVRNNL